ncbi:MAG: Hsp20/alpha crystallin family protein [Gammaproteobacteria bacterium]|jgi:HSP20 family protein
MFGNETNFEGSLFDEFRRMQEGMDEFFGRGPWPVGIRAVSRGTYPPINVGSTPEQVDVYLFAAGLDPKSLDISIQRNLLTVSGERKAPVKEGADYYRKERYDGSFRRLITLPEDVDPDQVSAHYSDGVLQIHIKRHETSRPRQIEVK